MDTVVFAYRVFLAKERERSSVRERERERKIEREIENRKRDRLRLSESRQIEISEQNLFNTKMKQPIKTICDRYFDINLAKLKAR